MRVGETGIELAARFNGLPCAEEILKIDVANYAGRIDPKEAQIVLTTKYKTEIRWGRPLNAKDFYVEVRDDQKIAALEQIVRQYRRADAGQPWIDLRFDRITYPIAANDVSPHR